MEAIKSCDFLTSLVKTSRLNYSLKESPFSAILTIKKKSGVEVPGEIFNFMDNSRHARNILEENNSLKAALEKMKANREASEQPKSLKN